jgi:hypothetical protein
VHRRKPIRAIEAVERRIKDTGSAVRIPARPSADHAVDERQPVAKSHIDAGWRGQEIRRLSERRSDTASFTATSSTYLAWQTAPPADA